MLKIKIKNQVIKNHVNAFNVANGCVSNDELKIIVAYKVENKILFAWENEGEYCINEIVQGQVSHVPAAIAKSKEDIVSLLRGMM